jgi:predicted nucleic-acid-binding protein
MIGLDTNVLIRYLTRDEPQQWQITDLLMQEILTNNETCFISNVVLCELAWVLRSSYKLSRADLIETLERILRTSIFRFENKFIVWQAIQQMRQGGADFSDYLIGLIHRQAGCIETVTFDAKLASDESFRLL